MDKTTQFSGFPQSGVKFLHDLNNNNNRDWFNQHKSTFKDELETPAKGFAAELAEQLSTLTKQPMSHKLFRIYRDVRFSKDKTPYNTHLHISFSCNGNCADAPAFHFGLELDRLFYGCGYFAFSNPKLTQYRELIAHSSQGDALRKILDSLESSKGYQLHDPELKRVPSGFNKEHPHADLLKRKGLVIWSEQKHSKKIHSSNFIQHSLNTFETMRPIYNWLLQLED